MSISLHKPVIIRVLHKPVICLFTLIHKPVICHWDTHTRTHTHTHTHNHLSYGTRACQFNMLPWPISKVASKWLSLHPTGACTNLPWDWPVQNTDNHMYYLGANVQTRLRVLTIVYNYSLGFVALPGVCRHLELSKWNGSSVQDLSLIHISEPTRRS